MLRTSTSARHRLSLLSICAVLLAFTSPVASLSLRAGVPSSADNQLRDYIPLPQRPGEQQPLREFQPEDSSIPYNYPSLDGSAASNNPSQVPSLSQETASQEDTAMPPLATFSSLIDALAVMQAEFWELWQGTWPGSIDWTAAVLGTYLAGALTTLTTSLDSFGSLGNSSSQITTGFDFGESENYINGYFTHAAAFYFGQNALALRGQAYDDMLWVVLGWLDAIKFISLHNSLHYSPTSLDQHGFAWFGHQWIAPLAHRARLFYDLASSGWDERLCDGGMIWSPYLEPYKNAITNELFITASVGMYLHFPGDNNSSPFVPTSGTNTVIPPAPPRNPKYLSNALDAYRWLRSSNMTNDRGLYVDGFHISGYRRGNNTNTRCDERNEMVYTYNQGVLLSGLRGLWESTGAVSFLEEGWELIEDVISATGFSVVHGPMPYNPKTRDDPDSGSDRWSGLGTDGILMELCDPSGLCSQNGQTFKGIFFHHLTEFCAALPLSQLDEGVTFAASVSLANEHDERCQSFGPWIERNARAALRTRDSRGRFGMWWGASHNESTDEDGNRPSDAGAQAAPQLPKGAVDYQNAGMLQGSSLEPLTAEVRQTKQALRMPDGSDMNERGRGRTVETQGGGLAVLRANWEITKMRGG